jgi:probable HAF family extracellular repeat protein
MARWTCFAVPIVVACGGGGTGTTDAPPGTDAPPTIDGVPPAIDARPFPASWSVTIVAPPAGDTVLLPLGIDAATGDVVGYTGPEAWTPLARPVRVTGTTVAVLDVPDANYGFAWGAASTISTGEYGWQPMAWEAGVRTPLPVPAGWFSGSAHAANDGGLVVGSWADYDDALPPNPIGPRPCTWTNGAVTPLELLDPDHPIGAAWAVNATGVIAGSLSTASGVVAVRWPASTAAPVALAIPNATLAEARAINAAGDVAGRASLAGGVTHAFVAIGAGATALLPFLAGGESYAEGFDLDAGGNVVGTASAGGGEAHAVVWTDGAIVDLNDRVVLPADVRYLSSAVGIDDRGRIAAEAVMTSGLGDSVRHLAILEPAD